MVTLFLTMCKGRVEDSNITTEIIRFTPSNKFNMHTKLLDCKGKLTLVYYFNGECPACYVHFIKMVEKLAPA